MRPWPGPRILIYHNIYDRRGKEMDLPLELFTAQLDWLQAKGRIVALEEAVKPGAEIGQRDFVLTFDDGYLSLYESAFPVLRERRLPFTLYLTTEPVVDQSSLAPRYRPLQWEHIHEMAESGLMTIGSHTHRHRDLRGLAEDEIADELETSDSLIRRHLGLTPRHFAYPKGYWDETAERLIRERYATAALGAGPPIRPEDDPHRLHRLPVQRSDGMFFFKRKMLRGMRLEETARKLVKGYRAPPG